MNSRILKGRCKGARILCGGRSGTRAGDHGYESSQQDVAQCHDCCLVEIARSLLRERERASARDLLREQFQLSLDEVGQSQR